MKVFSREGLIVKREAGVVVVPLKLGSGRVGAVKSKGLKRPFVLVILE